MCQVNLSMKTGKIFFSKKRSDQEFNLYKFLVITKENLFTSLPKLNILGAKYYFYYLLEYNRIEAFEAQKLIRRLFQLWCFTTFSNNR